MDRRGFVSKLVVPGSVGGLAGLGSLWNRPSRFCQVVSESRIDATKVSLTSRERASVSPVVFGDLPPAEQRVAKHAISESSEYSCRPDPEAFLAFGFRVAERTDEDDRAYLMADGEYYQLYVRIHNLVYAN